MDNNKNITDYLNRYVELKDPRYAVLLRGEWGCGKTYFIKKLLNKWKEDKNVDNDGYIIKPIYISLNGVSNIKSVNFLLNKEISPILYSKGAQTLKKVGKALSKGLLKLDFNDNQDLPDLSLEINPLDIFMSDNDGTVTGKRVIILDDLERCKIPADELFGYINNFVEHQKCKIIFIGHEDKIENDINKNYKEIKEKLIGQTFTIQEDIESAIAEFFKDAQECLSAEILKANKDIIIKIFTVGNTSNLRILRQSFLDFDRLLDLLEVDYTKAITEKKYQAYVRNILAYYILVYCEYRYGEEEVIKYQNFKAAYQEKENTNLQNLYRKYDTLIARNDLRHSSYIIPIKTLVEFVDKGKLCENSISEILALKEEYLFSKETQPWEIIYNRYEVENEDFKKNIELVKKTFFSNKVKAIFEVLHISALLLFYQKEDIIKLSKKQDVVKLAKKNIDRIFSEHNDFSSVYTALNDSNSRIKEYADSSSENFKEILDYAHTEREKRKTDKAKEYLKGFLENLSDNNTQFIENIVNHTAKELKVGNDYLGIFKDVSPKKLALRLLKLSIKSKNDFKFYLQDRYDIVGKYIISPIPEGKKEDLSFIRELKSILEKKVGSLHYMDKFTIKQLISTLDKIINKMEKE